MSVLEDKFSRQIGAVGVNTMNKLLNINVVIIGASTIGQEVIKCLALLGVKSIHIYDTCQLTKKMQKELYYVNENLSTKKKSKSLAENAQLFSKELHNGIDSKTITKFELDYITLHDIHAVIVTKLLDLEVFKIENHCMIHNIKFILGVNYELEGYIFSNFNNHRVTDKDGEPCESGYVESFYVEKDILTITIEALGNNIISKCGRLVSNADSIDFTIISSSKTEIITTFSKQIEDFLNSSDNIKFMEIKESYDMVYKPHHIISKNNKTSYIFW